MRPASSEELLFALNEMGTTPIESLVLRLTGSVTDLFRQFQQLEEEGLVEIFGDEQAVRELIAQAKLAEEESSDLDTLQEKLFEILKSNPVAADSAVGLTKAGFVRAQKL